MIRIMTAAAVVVVIAAVATPTVNAGDAQADVVRGTGCVFFDANGTPWFDADARVQIVSTNNPRGNVNARCQGSLPDGAVLPDRAMHFDQSNTGFVCLGVDDWKSTVTPSGRASFTCHIPNE